MLEVAVERQVVRVGSRFAVTFQRTLRVPDTDRSTFPLPPGLGVFPLFRVADYAERLPDAWRQRGGVFIAMYQREALWLGFHAARWKPNAVVVSVGGVNVVSGQIGGDSLTDKPQNYLVCPHQPWLDGINIGSGTVRQFVAMPLGSGHTVEAALSGAETTGGLQITVFEPRPGIFPDSPPPEQQRPASGPATPMASVHPMGLGAGGTLRQKIYPDPYGIRVWDSQNSGRVFVHILNSAQFHQVMGLEPPSTPVDAALYAKHGLPWFDLYDEHMGDVAPAPELSGVQTIAERDAELGLAPAPEAQIDPGSVNVIKLSNTGSASTPSRSPAGPPKTDNSSEH